MKNTTITTTTSTETSEKESYSVSMHRQVEGKSITATAVVTLADGETPSQEHYAIVREAAAELLEELWIFEK